MNSKTHTCSRCKQLKPASDFRADPRYRSGLFVWCRKCVSAGQSEWRKRHPKEARERDAAYRAKRIKGNPAFDVEHYRRYKALFKYKNLRKHYGLTRSQYETMIQKTGGFCDCCGEEYTRPFVDHCHITGIIRGIVCPSCNTAIGHLKDSVWKALEVLAYLLHTQNVEGLSEDYPFLFPHQRMLLQTLLQNDLSGSVMKGEPI